MPKKSNDPLIAFSSSGGNKTHTGAKSLMLLTEHQLTRVEKGNPDGKPIDTIEYLPSNEKTGEVYVQKIEYTEPGGTTFSDAVLVSKALADQATVNGQKLTILKDLGVLKVHLIEKTKLSSGRKKKE